jgi:glyoxylase-like metal-dependent hydrolase (beta-lactamase superfamily II)
MTLGSGANQIDLYWFGPGHTDGDAFVVFKQDKVMQTGDIMAWSMAPLIDPGSGGSALSGPMAAWATSAGRGSPLWR